MSMEGFLALFKADILKNYFKSTMFYDSDMEQIDAAIPAVGYDGKKEDIRACLYEGALFKKNRRYAIFTDSAFWAQTSSGYLVGGKYSQIDTITIDGTLKMFGKNATTITKKLAKRIKGIQLIYHLAHEGDPTFAKYMVSFEKPVFGEYVPSRYYDRASNLRKKLNLPGLPGWIFFNLKIKTLTDTVVEFEVSLNDKDLEKGSFSDWETALERFVNNSKVISGFQEVFYTTLCIKYKPENIRFNLNGKVKTTLSTRLKNAADVVSTVADKAMEITEDRMAQATRDRERAINNREAQVNAAVRSGAIDETTAKIERDKIAQARTTVQNRNATSKTTEGEVEQQDKRVKYQPGTAGVAFVFSCPGQKEELAGKVCAGKTGENLEILIRYLHEKRPEIFPSPLRGSYTITNASDRVHYMALTKDTEASYPEIAEPANIERLSSELQGCSVVVCMGDRADYAVRRTSVGARILRGEHLGHQNLNRNYQVDGETASDRNKQRVAIIGDKILQQL